MWKKTSCLILIVLFILVSCQKSETPQIQQYTIEQFMDTVSIFGSSFSADEQNILFSSNKSGIYNAYTLPVKGGEPTALTHSTEDAIFALSYFPNDNRILYSSDKGGNEITHIYLRNEDGSVKDLTPDAQRQACIQQSTWPRVEARCLQHVGIDGSSTPSRWKISLRC